MRAWRRWSGARSSATCAGPPRRCGCAGRAGSWRSRPRRCARRWPRCWRAGPATTSAALRRFMDRTWPSLNPSRVVFQLLGDRARLAAAASGILDEAEVSRLVRARRRGGFRQASWSMEDAYLVDEAIDVIDGTRTYGHVVADEAQDLSPMQLRAVGRRCRYGSATVLGDLAQGTSPWAAGGWSDALPHLGKTGPLELRATTPDRFTHLWLEALGEALDADGSVGLVAADPRVPELRAELERQGLQFRMVERFDLATRLSLVPASTLKAWSSTRSCWSSR